MRDRVKRMLGFVLVATIDGPPGSPRQTHIPRSRLQSGFGDRYRWPLTSISFLAGGRRSAMGTQIRRPGLPQNSKARCVRLAELPVTVFITASLVQRKQRLHASDRRWRNR